MTALSTTPPSDLAPQRPERPSDVLHAIADGINKVAGAPAQAIDYLNTGFAMATQGIAKLFPALPAAAMGSLVIGFPHAHVAHPPSGPPPIPPTPLPPIGVVLAGCCVQVLINGRPAARCGDIILNPTCCGLPPLGEIKTGSSSVFIGGARAARVADITMHCTPVPGGAGARAAKTASAMAMKALEIGGMALQAAGMVAQGFEIAADAVESTETEDPAMSAALGLNAGMMAAQMAMDVATMALAAAMGKDPCLPPTGTPGLVTAITSGDVLIGGFPMPGWMDIAQGLFKLAKGLKKKTRKSQNNKCDRPGHPINPVTGANEDEFIDYEEDSPLAFCWGRNYTSADANRAGPMGYGFRHTYERSLTLDLDGAVYTDAEGKRVEFPPVAPGQPKVAREGYVLSARTEGDDTIYALTPTADEPTMEFVHKSGRDATPRLMRLVALEEHADLLYDAHGRLTGMIETAPAGTVETAFLYDARGHLVEVRRGPRNGRTLPRIAAYAYDQAGCLVAWEDALGARASYAYDAAHRIVRMTDRNGYSFHFTYDDQGRCIEEHGDDGLWRVALRYAPEQRRTFVTEADGGEWLYEYDANQTLVAIHDPYGGKRQRVLDDEGKVVRELGPDGRTQRRFLYDAAGKNYGLVDHFGYFHPPLDEEPNPPNPPGHHVADTMPEQQFGGAFEAGLEDPTWLQELPEAMQAFASTLRSDAPATGEPIVRHDELGRPIEEIDAAGQRQARAYDASGNEVRYVDRDGREHTTEIVSWNLVGAEVDPLGWRTQYHYTARAKVACIVDPGGSRSDYHYDLKDRLVRVRRHGVVREEYVYDQADRLVEKRDGAGTVLLRLSIGDNGLPAARHLSSGEVHRYTYDECGRILRADADAIEVRRGFTAWGQLSFDEWDGRGVRHGFDEVFDLRETTCLGRFTVTYNRDPDGTLRIITPEGGMHWLQSDGRGTILATLGNGTRVLASYDEEGRCLGRATWRSEGIRNAHWSMRCLYSAEGELRRVEDTVRGVTDYRYDAAHRVIGESGPNGRNAAIVLDAAGNIRAKPGLAEVTLLEGNRFAAAGSERFRYDARNHMVEQVDADGATTCYRYNSLDMLVGVTWSGRTEEWSAAYDGLGRRLYKALGNQRTEYFWAGDRLAAEVGPTGALRLYVYAGPEALVPLLFIDYDSVEADPTSGWIYYPVGNQLGVPLHIEDGEGKVVWWADHVEPYGTVTVRPNASIAYALRFPGHYLDDETGLHYNRFRYYSPRLGRYLQSDPAGQSGGINLYAYPGNPLVDADVLGLTLQSGQSSSSKQSLSWQQPRYSAPGHLPANEYGYGKANGATGQDKAYTYFYDTSHVVTQPETTQSNVKGENRPLLHLEINGKQYMFPHAISASDPARDQVDQFASMFREDKRRVLLAGDMNHEPPGEGRTDWKVVKTGKPTQVSGLRADAGGGGELDWALGRPEDGWTAQRIDTVQGEVGTSTRLKSWSIPTWNGAQEALKTTGQGASDHAPILYESKTLRQKILVWNAGDWKGVHESPLKEKVLLGMLKEHQPTVVVLLESGTAGQPNKRVQEVINNYNTLKKSQQTDGQKRKYTEMEDGAKNEEPPHKSRRGC